MSAGTATPSRLCLPTGDVYCALAPGAGLRPTDWSSSHYNTQALVRSLPVGTPRSHVTNPCPPRSASRKFLFTTPFPPNLSSRPLCFFLPAAWPRRLLVLDSFPPCPCLTSMWPNPPALYKNRFYSRIKMFFFLSKSALNRYTSFRKCIPLESRRGIFAGP